jgi:hypothetical protein
MDTPHSSAFSPPAGNWPGLSRIPIFLPAAKPTGLRVVQVVVVVVVWGGGQTYFFLFQIKLKSMRHLKILSNKIKIISNFHLNFVK